MRTLDGCIFFLLCKDCKQTRWMLASIHATASNKQRSASVTHILIGFRFYKHEFTVVIWEFSKYFQCLLQENKTGDSLFSSFNVLLELQGNAREQIEKFFGRKFLLNKNFLLSTLAGVPGLLNFVAKNCSVEFF